ncbi:MAG TPA: short-chain dehydrogenase/reductase [Burkholderiales bacterium]|nr:short-chain dehydrogenase/reductase [Burkholderiales bacterium]
MDLGLSGKSVLVTGGSKGIGLACAKAFAAEGCHVHLAARDRARLEKTKSELGGRATVHGVDLRDGKALCGLAEACRDVDILVNNAGDIPGGTLASVDEEKWRHAWELKVFAYINLSRSMYARMQARKSGVIVNVIGMAAEKPAFEYICGSTANAGLAAFTKALGKGMKPHGVRVLGVHPPSTRTDRIVTVMKGAAKAKFGDESRYQELAGEGPFAGLIEPEQVADVVAFLASPRCAHLTGVVLNLGP